MKTFGRKLLSVAVAAALGGVATGAAAGGFAIGTQSGSGTGNAFAGGAAAADDASVAWFNPALMTLLPGKQAAGALHILKPSFKFENQGSTGAFAAPGTGDGGDGGDLAYVPNGFFTWAINPNLSFGLALNVPFGLKTEYDAGWRGQLIALKSEIKTVNLNPTVAYKISDTVSIGGGFSYQKLEAELTNSAGAAGIAKLTADDDGFGYNLGVMFHAGQSTRIGAHYRSKIKYDLEGQATFSGNPAGNSNVRADLEVPDSLSLSAFHTMGNWELMGDVTWTGWSSIQQLQVIRTSGPLSGATLTTLQFQWDDTWRYGIGANYKMSPQTKLRFGLAFDETPTNDTHRSPRLPDQDRTWVALGVQWKPSKTSILDVGYAHEFIKDARISTSTAPLSCPANCLNGTFKNQADILSVQFSMSF
jgi:long-chain fatty acid transport protein